MLIDTSRGPAWGSDVRGFGSFGGPECSGGSALLARVDTLRDALFDAEVGVENGGLADEAAGKLNAPLDLTWTPDLLQSAVCETYKTTLKDLISRMEAALKGAGKGVPPATVKEKFALLSLPVKIGLGLGAVAVGAGVIAVLFKKR